MQVPDYADPAWLRFEADMAVFRIMISRLWAWLAISSPVPRGFLEDDLAKMVELALHDDVITTNPPEYDDAAREMAVAKLRHIMKLAADLLPPEV